MLYLIESPAIERTESGERNFHCIYKVGYASNLERRVNQYKVYNPYCLLVSERDGTLEDERIIHYILRGLGLSLDILNEWYKYDSKVKEIFNLPMSELRKMLWDNRDKFFPRTIFQYTYKNKDQDLRSTGHKIFIDLYNEFIPEEEKSWFGKSIYIEGCEIISQTVSKIDELYRKYQDSLTVTKSIEDLNNITTSEYISRESVLVSNFLTTEFLNTGIFSTKLRAYCKFRDQHKDDSVLIAELNARIRDPKFSRYYEFYGSGGCGTRKYSEGNLRKGLKSELNYSNLPKAIYSTFKEGDKFSMQELKDRVKELFISLGITDKKPKATVLSDYFEMSKTKITLPDKTVVNGFKILKRKEN